MIKIKWFFRNKLDENVTILRNKARLIEKGYNQHEDINFNEVIRILFFLLHHVL